MPLTHWYRRAFVQGDYPLIRLMDTPEWIRKTLHEAKFAKEILNVEAGEAVLDACCGAGRHSIELQKMGMRVTGIDLSPVYLKEAERRAKLARANPEWIEGDVRKVKWKERFDAAVNLFTSFGYFLKQEEDTRFLKAIARSLRPGSRFLLDTVNAERILKNGPSNLWERLPDGTLILKETRFARGKKAILTDWTILSGRKRSEYTAFTRLYTRQWLADTLKASGFRVLDFFGAMSKERFKPDSSTRLVALCEKR